MGLSWISCGDVAATLMTSPRVWKNNYCAKPPRGKEGAFLNSNAFPHHHHHHHLHKPVCREMLRSPCVLIAVTGCHSLWQVQHYSWSHENVVHTSGYCKVDELLKWLIMISDALSIMSREQGFNLTANITLQQLQPIKGVFHTSFVIWQLLLSKALEMRNKCVSCSL